MKVLILTIALAAAALCEQEKRNDGSQIQNLDNGYEELNSRRGQEHQGRNPGSTETLIHIGGNMGLNEHGEYIGGVLGSGIASEIGVGSGATGVRHRFNVRTVIIPRPVPLLQPYPVTIDHPVPVPHAVFYPVEIPRPVPVAVLHAVPVEVPRPVPVPLLRPYPALIPHPVDNHVATSQPFTVPQQRPRKDGDSETIRGINLRGQGFGGQIVAEGSLGGSRLGDLNGSKGIEGAFPSSGGATKALRTTKETPKSIIEIKALEMN